MARGKATRLEARAKSAASWRSWLAGKALPGPGGIVPTRRAFQLVRGLAGWTRSPVGMQIQQDELPGESDDLTD